MSAAIENNTSPLYAVIDLGSNSFHMLITRQLADSVQVVDKVKRKVRLASGLDSNNLLNQSAIARGLECLSFFAERLQDIPPENIRIVATATLRLATNRASFINAANTILGHKVTLLSGLQEAESIYLGVAHTSSSAKEKLVVDIGGASTELIIGSGFTIEHAISIDIGCVTFNAKFFEEGQLSPLKIEQAINYAKQQLAPYVAQYQSLGWQVVLGGSGTMQALAEILIFEKQPSLILYSFLQRIKLALTEFECIDDIVIEGLTSERVPVFVSGLTILIALFEALKIEQLQLSSGALREGLLYEMLPNSRQIAIRQRTVSGLSLKFHIDTLHAQRIQKQVTTLLESFAPAWQLVDKNEIELLHAATALHEIGLLLEYKRHQQHGAYLLNNADIPGFEQPERQFIAALVKLYKGGIDVTLLKSLSAVSFQHACYYLTILRLAIILCRRRQDDVLPSYQTKVENNTIFLCLPNQWLAQHPLIADELLQENKELKKIGLTLKIQCE
ncbi:guanosine-5'-triphosphate,3'-diphosphate pyrophosphatase [Thalassotalea piscium]|uniref:Exopolyphosphatase/guanosine-5'-triphosphate, 3'-diphosphate pyrophosphatase n=1 Tax=Thalassotalea piscium TaxID=1230533 RepID=A0A7X0NFN8_9GAMM|nr:guanosine-5'-triphosphate,3'-diphosphate pyrophosphatase [Thalassotalea piscium]MBB6542607.1 exopolyphosphatase/guanosine-5'-triphosphate,3'-diphosphate pyrophosphatase [Thalassotalea piscium]